jgi:hypothetical protein
MRSKLMRADEMGHSDHTAGSQGGIKERRVQPICSVAPKAGSGPEDRRSNLEPPGILVHFPKSPSGSSGESCDMSCACGRWDLRRALIVRSNGLGIACGVRERPSSTPRPRVRRLEGPSKPGGNGALPAGAFRPFNRSESQECEPFLPTNSKNERGKN